MPALRLIGARDADADRIAGDACVGAMRFQSGVFEYWIGMLCLAGTDCPDGYASADLPECDLFTGWLHGREEKGELYGEEPQERFVARAAEGLAPVALTPWGASSSS